jgi:hypothetical protein
MLYTKPDITYLKKVHQANHPAEKGAAKNMQF